MTLDQLKNDMPDYAKDIKLNLSNVLSEAGSPGLTEKQILSIALSTAYMTGQAEVINSAIALAKPLLTQDEMEATKAATVIMAMNNIYYRFTHTMTDTAYASMPANLRMNVMANPGSDKISFELCSLAVSAMNGCGKCMNAHATQLEKAGVSKQGIQSAVRIASVIQATATTRNMMAL
jgi:lipoyl-dependent peroxiredoxin subunit D